MSPPPNGFEIDDFNRGHADAQLLDDLRRVARELQSESLTQVQYRKYGKYSPNTIANRFRTWNEALHAAGLRVSKRHNIPEEELFENLAAVWNTLARQPRREEMEMPLSKFHGSAYEYRFGSWGGALRAFVTAMSERGETPKGRTQSGPAARRRPTPKAPGWRIRFLVMRRDRFRCRACGMSPSTHPETRLVIDHVQARSKGGGDEIENLQTLCEPCNGGKSDLAWDS